MSTYRYSAVSGRRFVYHFQPDRLAPAAMCGKYSGTRDGGSQSPINRVAHTDWFARITIDGRPRCATCIDEFDLYIAQRPYLYAAYDLPRPAATPDQEEESPDE